MGFMGRSSLIDLSVVRQKLLWKLYRYKMTYTRKKSLTKIEAEGQKSENMFRNHFSAVRRKAD